MRPGYTFGGWFKEAACINEWNFNTAVVTSSITLYAKWTSTASPVKPGYIDGDKKIGVGDALEIFKYIAGMKSLLKK
jgi:uncharacterized repeat protein (TIGR02543 family)